MKNQVTKSVNVRFIGNKEIVDFAIECLRIQLRDNIKYRRMEDNFSWEHIEAEIISIK